MQYYCGAARRSEIDFCAQIEKVGKKLSAVEAERVRQAADDWNQLIKRTILELIDFSICKLLVTNVNEYTVA